MKASSGRSSPPAPASSSPSSPPRRRILALGQTGAALCAAGRRPGRRARPSTRSAPQTPQGALALLSYVSPHVSGRLAVAGAAILLGLLTAAIEISNWDTVLRFLYQVPYGESDPVFGKDIGFYLFSLPAYVALKNWLLLLLFFSAAIAGGVYWVQGDIEFDTPPRGLSPAALTHASVLLGLYFVVKAWSYALDRYLLLYSDNGVVVGAGYTDLHVRLPILWLLIGLAAACAIASWVNVRWRNWRIPAAAVALLFATSFVVAVLFPALFNRFYVKPSELQLETPYIERNIALTRQAYNLQQIEVKPIAVGGTAELRLARGQPRDRRQYPAVGLAAADEHLCPAPGDQDLLQIPRHGHRPLSPGRHLSAGDAVGARARAFAAAVQCADLGQPPSALHPRQRRGDVAGDAKDQRRPADLLPAGHPVRRQRRSRHPRAAPLFRPGRGALCDRQGQHARVRLSQGQGQRLCHL